MFHQDNYDQRGGSGRRQQSFASVAGGNQGGYRNQGRYNNYNNDDGYGGGGGGRRNNYRENNYQQHWEREPLRANEDADMPEEVRMFLNDLKESIRHRDTVKVQHLYEAEFRGLSEVYYQARYWPHPKVIEDVIGDLPERVFVLLYKELYYRHIYESSREGPSIEQRFESYSNYWQIFDLILNRDTPLDIGLPNEWVWDMIDEFMYQFTHFCTYRAKADRLPQDELNMLKDSHVWNVNIVMNIWLKLVETSRIQEQLEIYNAGGDPTSKFESGSFADHPMYKMLGYYSLISLMRLHCLLGDYYSALKVLDNVELGKKHLLQASGLQACLVATYYHVGVCYMMMRRYQDAIRTFCDLLLYQQRATTPILNRNAPSSGVSTQFTGGRTYQVDTLGKTIDKMYSCLAICLILHPMHIDESISSSLRDKLGDRLNKIQKSGPGVEEEFEKVLNQGLPKFITPVTNYDDIQPNSLKEFQTYQLGILMKEFSAQSMVANIQSYLKLYTSMPIQKLARFLELKTDDELIQHLYTYKHKMTNIVHTHGSPLNGNLVCRPELDFYIDRDMIYIADTKVAPRYGDFFVRNIQKFEELTETLKQIKVPGKE